MDSPNKKSGFVVLVGRSNVGKSSLLNALVGTKVAITTPKPQTTRHALQGIVHHKRGQIVFIDTPGIFHKGKDVLTKKLNARVRDSMRNIDALIYVVDPTKPIGPEERELLSLVDTINKPKFLVINKSDIPNPPFIEEYKALAKNFNDMISVSATDAKNLNLLMEKVLDSLPEGEPFYPEHQLTNVENKLWFAELIREKVFMRLHQELPYSTNVEVDEIEERETGVLYIRARILTHTPRYKGMIVGKGGHMIKSIGQSARRDIEAITQKKVYLELEVEVSEHWAEAF